MSQSTEVETLSRFFPVESVGYIMDLCRRDSFRLKICRGRISKLGDFRPSANGRAHLITVNGVLNVYACLLIFLHELAHLYVWKLHGRLKRPHGLEWKTTFGQLIRDFINKGYFHPSLSRSLIDYSYRVKATGMADKQLLLELMVFDGDHQPHSLLEEIPEKGYFLTRNGKMFRKGERLRTRYKCVCLDTKKSYLFHPLAKVVQTNQ